MLCSFPIVHLSIADVQFLGYFFYDNFCGREKAFGGGNKTKKLRTLKKIFARIVQVYLFQHPQSSSFGQGKIIF